MFVLVQFNALFIPFDACLNHFCTTQVHEDNPWRKNHCDVQSINVGGRPQTLRSTADGRFGVCGQDGRLAHAPVSVRGEFGAVLNTLACILSILALIRDSESIEMIFHRERTVYSARVVATDCVCFSCDQARFRRHQCTNSHALELKRSLVHAYIQNGVHLIYYDPHDQHAFEEKLMYYWKHPEEARKIAEAG